MNSRKYPRLPNAFDAWLFVCWLMFPITLGVVSVMGHPWIGILLGAAFTLVSMELLWRYQWGTWSFK
jgi:hypothetical protein